MKAVYDVTDSGTRDEALDAAASVIGQGGLVVMPTDTVYGIAANAFDASGVHALLAAKGRGRDKPSAVLVPRPDTVEGLAMAVPSYARRLMEAFWPGALTLVFRAQPSLAWDLGETNGTVGLRMPDDEVALALLERTGPLAVSSANRTGETPVTTIGDAGFAFGPAVGVYLDGGERVGGVPSTILDCTKADPMLLRRGGVTPEQLREVLGPVDLLDSTGAPLSEVPDGVSVEEPNGLDAQDGTAHDASTEAPSDETGDEVGEDAFSAHQMPPAPGSVGIGAEPPFGESEQSARVPSAEHSTRPAGSTD